jgi:hypothetical protein
VGARHKAGHDEFEYERLRRSNSALSRRNAGILPVKVAAARPDPQIHCVFMTIPLHFYDTPQAPAASSVSWSSPAKAQRQCRV